MAERGFKDLHWEAHDLGLCVSLALFCGINYAMHVCCGKCGQKWNIPIKYKNNPICYLSRSLFILRDIHFSPTLCSTFKSPQVNTVCIAFLMTLPSSFSFLHIEAVSSFYLLEMLPQWASRNKIFCASLIILLRLDYFRE